MTERGHRPTTTPLPAVAREVQTDLTALEAPMNRIELDPSDDSPWRGGLTRMAANRATVEVTVVDLEDTIDGELVEVTADGGIVLEKHDETDPTSGTATWVALDRVITVAVHYRRTSEPMHQQGALDRTRP